MFKSQELKNMNKKAKIEDFQKLYHDFDIDMLLEFIQARKAGVVDNDFYNYYSTIALSSENLTTSQFYKYTNENLTKFFNEIDMSNIKRVATVGSSGDQAINAVFYGAKEVDLIDLNFFTKVYTELKIAGVKALNHKDFIHFFNKFPRDFSKYYSQISYYLPEKIKFFYDTLLLNGDVEILHPFIQTPNSRNQDYLGSEIFYDSNKFDELKDVLINGDYKINYIFGEFMEFPDKLNGKYDLILLSNIMDYYHKTHFTEKCVEDFISVVSKLYHDNLNKNGLIQLTTQPGRDMADFDTLVNYVRENKMDAFFISSAGMWNKNIKDARLAFMLRKNVESESFDERN